MFERLRQIIWIAIFAATVGAIYGHAQGPTIISRPCPASTTKAKVDVKKIGDIDLAPCPGRSVLVSGSPLSGGAASVPGEALVSSYASYAAAVAAIGSVTKTKLIVTASSSVSADLTVPKNITTVFEANGSLSIASTKTVSIAGEIIAPRNQQIFAGAGNVSFAGIIPDTVYPEWWGALGDGVTDDLAAFDKIIASIPGAGDTQASPRIALTNGKTYVLSDTWQIETPVLVEGFSADNWSNTAIIKAAANKTGIIIHHTGTKDGNPASRRGIFSRFRNFFLNGTSGSTTHTVTINGLTVTRTAGTSFADTSGYHDGNTITINGFTYTIATFVDVDTITVYKPRLYGVAHFGTTDVRIGDYNLWPTTGEWSGQQIIINGGTYTVASVSFSDAHHITLTTPYLGTTNAYKTTATYSSVSTGADEFTSTAHGFETGMQIRFLDSGLPAPLAANTDYYLIKTSTNTYKLASSYANSQTATAIDLTTGGTGNHAAYSRSFAGDAELQSLANTAGLAARPNLFHGIDVRGPAEISGMKIWNFNGNGISLDSSLTPGISGTTPNANNSRLSRNSLYYNFGNGIYLKGINSNQSYIDNNDATSNHGAGIFDGSFLGNNYFGNHTSFNYFAPSYYTGDVNVSALTGEYSEGGSPSSKFPQYVLLIGGNHAAGFDPASKHTYLRNNQGVGEIDALKSQTTSGAKTVAFRQGMGASHNTILGFGAADEPTNLSSGGALNAVNRFQYQIGYDQLATGWYDLYQGGQYTDHSKPLLAFSGENASAGSGVLAFPTGFRTGLADSHINKMLRGTVTIDPANINATTFSSQTFTLTGAVVGDNLVLNPPAGGLTAGLLVGQIFVSAANTLTVVFYNTSGGAIDEASGSWQYQLTR